MKNTNHDMYKGSKGAIKKIRGFEPVIPEMLKTYNDQKDVIMPLRGTKTSAGYDFFAPEEIEILSGESYLFWSDIKAYMLYDEVLEIYPRSSVGIKKNIMIKNTVGIIDSDYYNNPKNDGNIGLFLFNFGDRTTTFKKGEGVAQAIFKKFLESDNCNTTKERKGGVGSTNK